MSNDPRNRHYCLRSNSQFDGLIHDCKYESRNLIYGCQDVFYLNKVYGKAYN